MNTLSIAIPTFNRAHALYETLLRIDAVIPIHVPLVIRDNASTDSTLEIVKKFKSDSKREVIVNTNDQNMGIDYNIIKVVEDVSTDYVWLLGDDDSFTDNAYERYVSILNSYKNIGLIFSNYSVWDNIFLDCLKSNVFDQKEDVYFADGRDIINIVGELLSVLSCLVIRKKEFIEALAIKPIALTGTAVDFVWCLSHILTKSSAYYVGTALINWRSGDEDRGFSWTRLTQPYLQAIKPATDGRPDLAMAAKRLCLERSLVGKIRATRISGNLSFAGRIQVLTSLFPIFFGFRVYWTRVIPWLLFPYQLIKLVRE